MACLIHCNCRRGFHEWSLDEGVDAERYEECCKCGHRKVVAIRRVPGGVLEAPDDGDAERETRYAEAEAEGRDLKGEEIL